jgi:N-acyl-D-aspartate/D-glutamate deacylase
MIVDASAPTYMLTHWARDRKCGPGLPLEYIVKRLTSETADFFGFHDRGRLEPGTRADINLIDFARLRLHAHEVVNDLPAGGKRLVQRAEGYEAPLVAGVPVFERAASPPAPSPAVSRAAGGRDWLAQTRSVLYRHRSGCRRFPKAGRSAGSCCSLVWSTSSKGSGRPGG